MWTSNYFHRKKKKRKNVFGGSGEIKPHEEVTALNKRINAQEQKEFEKFDKEFDVQAEGIWK